MAPRNLPWRNISWKVLERCNYRCSYCLQKTYGYNADYPEDLEDILECINCNLKENYEIKIAGGEIFCRPEKAILIADRLSAKGHWLSLCTNLSSKADDYCRFIEATRGNFYTFGASLHLEYVENVNLFLDKCKQIKACIPVESKFQIHNVITRGIESIIKLSEIEKKFEEEGFIFYTDLLVDEHGKYINYSEKELEYIRELLGEEERLIKHKGKLCRGGNTYFAMTPSLDVWCCWDSWYADDKSMYLGNMKKGTFKQMDNPINCPYESCSCPTPIFKQKYKIYQ